jgi:hypothetical protein
MASESAVREFSQRASLEGSQVRPLKVSLRAPDATPGEVLWLWRTAFEHVPQESLLRRHRTILVPLIASMRSELGDVRANLVIEREDADPRPGCYLSPQLVALLHEYGAAFECDVVTQLT